MGSCLAAMSLMVRSGSHRTAVSLSRAASGFPWVCVPEDLPFRPARMGGQRNAASSIWPGYEKTLTGSGYPGGSAQSRTLCRTLSSFPSISRIEQELAPLVPIGLPVATTSQGLSLGRSRWKCAKYTEADRYDATRPWQWTIYRFRPHWPAGIRPDGPTTGPPGLTVQLRFRVSFGALERVLPHPG